ncbi:zinc finger protein 862-like [Mytilus galloprovincialis]|uniref:zinc finger protein 862-like n=1 Tax=Mytilus galloprovincialis TaxID=29158 RepID=UPI003F7C280D
MLQWTAGAKPGKAFKRKRTDDDVTEQTKKYEVTRTRGFKPHWKTDRQWLQLDEKSSVMVCTYCKDNNKSNNFAKGTSNFRLEAIQAHENSQQHKTASLVSTRPAAEKSEAAKAVVKLKAHEYDRMNVLFRNAHAIAKHHLAFKFYPILCQLDKAKGLDVGETYLNDKKAREFVHHIANVSRSQVNELLDASKFISVTCDGTSDFMGDEYESLYVRTSISGKVTDSFFCLGTAESACALDIFSFIKSTFEREDRTSNTDLWTKIVGFGSDGASNMQGKRSGVAAHLREENPEIVIIHCLAHRLELAFKDAIKQIGNRLYEKTTTLLLGLYYFYRKGPKQKKMLKKTFKLLAMSRIMPTRIGGTRWLPHMQRAIGSFIKGYTAIKTQLETASHDNAKAEGLAKIMGDVAVITFIIILKVIKFYCTW